jgi:hypothetical protein
MVVVVVVVVVSSIVVRRRCEKARGHTPTRKNCEDVICLLCRSPTEMQIHPSKNLEKFEQYGYDDRRIDRGKSIISILSVPYLHCILVGMTAINKYQ